MLLTGITLKYRESSKINYNDVGAQQLVYGFFPTTTGPVKGALDSSPSIALLFTRSPVTSTSHSLRFMSRTGERDGKIRVPP